MVHMVHGTFWKGHKPLSTVGYRSCQEPKLETLPVGEDLHEGLLQRFLAYSYSKTSEVVTASRPG